MGKKLAILLLILTGLAGVSGGYVVGGLQAYSRYQQAMGQQHCGGQKPVHVCVQAPAEVFSAYYPFDLSTHTSLFSVTYSSSSSPLTLLISVSITGFTQVETHTVTAASAAQSTSFMPAPLNQAVRNLTSDLSTSLHVKVTDTRNTTYYLNDSLLLLHAHQVMQWVAANRLKIAAWVTPDDPQVISLVTKAAAHLSIQTPPVPTGMIGYLHATPQEVRDQVDAIYDALWQDYHMRYVIENVPYNGPGDSSVALENIKLPSEVLQQRSGMCIELTILLASAVEKIGLYAEIVIIPGHAFLGVATTPYDRQFQYWDGVQVNNGVAGVSANIYADQEYSAHARQIVDTIQISVARQQGVGPMV